MIVVDSSAIVAILNDEPDAHLFEQALAASRSCVISASTLLELRQVIGGRKQPGGIALANTLLASAGITAVSFTPQMADLATEAFLKYGKGQGHPAQLNFGDCIAYALAKSLDAPLLYKGEDFSRTDIVAAAAAV